MSNTIKTNIGRNKAGYDRQGRYCRRKEKHKGKGIKLLNEKTAIKNKIKSC